MTSAAATDPYVWDFTATVEDVDGTRVVLDTSYFYPEGGGQSADRGTIDAVDVTDVQRRGGRVVHDLEMEPGFEPGDTVEASIDREFRRYCMRAHTASHVLYGAGRRLLDDLGYGGFDISAEKVRVDFATPTEIDGPTLVELERLTNLAVWESRPVTWEELPRVEALGREDIAFNATTEEGLSGDAVRVVTVEGWDVAACGGTHVRNTREIGPVTVIDRSNPGQGLTRVEFAVGPWAIERRATERGRATEAAATLETGIDDLPGEVERLRAERDAFAVELENLHEAVVDARIAELSEEPIEKNGDVWLVGTIPSLDANGLADRARRLVDGEYDAVALVGEEGGYFAVATTGTVDARAVVTEVTDMFGGGGGGSTTVAQGGGFEEEAAEVVTFLREWSA